LDTDREIAERIVLEVQAGLVMLAPHLRSWVEEHLTRPRRVELSTNIDGTSFKTYWLITDHKGKDDSTYRVAYDEEARAFGLEVTLETDVELYMGTYGTFSETIENM
jgi:hypothetical protein